MVGCWDLALEYGREKQVNLNHMNRNTPRVPKSLSKRRL